MRVGLFTPTLYRIGGAELVAVTMANALKQHGYEVIVSSNKRIDQMKMRKFYGESADIDAQIIFPFHFFSAYSHYNTYTLALQSFILKLNCDILIDVYGISPFSWCDIVYFQGSNLLKNSSSFGVRSAFFVPYFKLLKPFKNLHEKTILANSKFKARFLKDYFQKNELPFERTCCDVLYPPVATSFFRPDVWNLNRPRKNVSITVSRISPGKRLEIVPYIAKLTPKDTSFIIVGASHVKKTMCSILRLTKKLGVTDRVKVLTDVPRDQLKTLLCDSKVYLHTMPDEAFGISIIEGMSSGCTPVVHDSGGPMEFIPKSFRYKSVEEAATRIEEAISNWTPERAKIMSESAARFDKKEFSRKFIHVVNSYAENLQSEKKLSALNLRSEVA
ncbi:MAG: glycosyltransferase [Candidatus Hodarchaeales archaeon]